MAHSQEDTSNGTKRNRETSLQEDTSKRDRKVAAVGATGSGQVLHAALGSVAGNMTSPTLPLQHAVPQGFLPSPINAAARLQGSLQLQLQGGGIPPAILHQLGMRGQPQIPQFGNIQAQAQQLQAIQLLAGISQQQQQTVDINSLILRQALSVPVAPPVPVPMPSPPVVNPAQLLQALADPAVLQLLQLLRQQQQPQPPPPPPPAVLPSEIDAQQQVLQLQQALAMLASREQEVRGVGRPPVPAVAAAPPDAAAPATQLPPSSGVRMSLPIDKEHLSEYQLMVRRQLEIFEAKQEEVDSNTQGRKRQVFLGQAGIRCRHCSNLPLRQRGRGAVYYPAKLTGMYQAAQNMASSHLSESCSRIPEGVKQRLRDLRERRDTASGGKHYWADAGRALGLYETEGGLMLRHAPSGKP